MTICKRIQLGDKAQLDLLCKISRDTFFATFQAKSERVQMELYMQQAFSEQQLNHEIYHPHTQFYILYSAGNACGYFKINFSTAQSEPKPDNYLEIQRIYLYPEYQGKGIADDAIEYIKTVAKLNYIKVIWLGVAEDNYRAYRFYGKQGFKPNGVHLFDFAGEIQSDICMEMLIPDNSSIRDTR
jgi:ribosomal protein S18 acetylase RimI-like enzyme